MNLPLLLTGGATSLVALMVPYAIQLRRAARRAQGAARQAEEEKRNFVRAVGHEIRNPLQAINGMAEALIDEQGMSAEKRAVALVIRDAAVALQQTVNNLQGFSNNPVPLEIGMLDLHALIGDVRDAVTGMAREKGVQLDLTVEPNAPYHIDSDINYLRQIIWNVVGHVLGLTHSDRIDIRIHGIEATSTDDVARISIVDHATPALDARAGVALFEPFGAQNLSEGGVPPGTGLHLYAARSFARFLGGDVTLVLQDGMAQYEIIVPVKIWDTVSAASSRHKEVLVSLRDQLARHRGQLQPQRILVAEDQRSNQQVMSSVFGGAGHHVTIVGSGEDALDRLSRDDYDVVFVDLHLPGMHGFDVMKLARVAESPRNRGIPLVVITGDTAPDIQRRSELAGAAAFLAKPVTSSRLLEVLTAVRKDALPASIDTMASSGVIDLMTAIGPIDPADYDGVIPRKIADTLKDILRYLGDMERAATRPDWAVVQLRARAIRGAAYLIGAGLVVEAAGNIAMSTPDTLAKTWPVAYESVVGAIDQACQAIYVIFQPSDVEQ